MQVLVSLTYSPGTYKDIVLTVSGSMKNSNSLQSLLNPAYMLGTRDAMRRWQGVQPYSQTV